MCGSSDMTEDRKNFDADEQRLKLTGMFKIVVRYVADNFNSSLSVRAPYPKLAYSLRFPLETTRSLRRHGVAKARFSMMQKLKLFHH